MITTVTYPQPILRLLAALLFFCLFVPMAAGQDPATDSNWKDQISGVTRIANEDGGDDNKIKPDDNNSGVKYFMDCYFALSADIDLSAHYWTPIGRDTNNPFKGNFDGQGHCVKGLKVNADASVGIEAYAGLFGNAPVGTLRNLGVRLADAGIRAIPTDTHAYAGGIDGKATNIFNCYVAGEGTVEAMAIKTAADANPYYYAGGIVGELASISSLSSLTHCYATVDVKAEGYSSNNAGGIAGKIESKASLSCTYATGSVEAVNVGDSQTLLNYAGGICGYVTMGGSELPSSLENCLALNESIKGDVGNRIVGQKAIKNVTLSSNYASPEIPVNGKLVDNGAGDNEGRYYLQ